MEFKFDKKMRIQIHADVLWRLREGLNEKTWYSVFLKRFGDECGLKFSGKRKGDRNSTYLFENCTYHFKIADKNKYMLAKIKYGI